MKRILKWSGEIPENELNICSEIIKQNGIVVFPTETVYGIGANALSQEAVKKIYLAKNREEDNPLIVHVSDKEMVKQIASDISGIEQKLMDFFMPGPFTLILKKKSCIPNNVSAGLDSIGVRMPSNKIAHAIIEASGVPIAAPSANISGRPSGTMLEDIKEELQDRVDLMIDGGMCEIGLESTVVKVIDNMPVILRPGKITKEDIEAAVGICQISPKVFEKVEKNEKVESPGMKYRHYAPKTACVLVKGNEKEQIEKINQKIYSLKKENKRVCVIGFTQHRDKIQCEYYLDVGSIEDLQQISQNIFRLLRQVDQMNVDIVVIEGVPEKGIGLAIVNRLMRACEYQVI